MLALSTLHTLLSQVLAPPGLHSAVLTMPSGALISFSTVHPKHSSHVRVIAGVASEVWQETRDKDQGMVESELGRILVLPVYDSNNDTTNLPRQPLMLVCLNATDAVSWDDLRTKGDELTTHLGQPLSKFRDVLAAPKPPPPRSQIPLR
ncbi:hypothetical protein DL96DRAFT_1575102 [Flagelloscypha sp. PMI_526]|nr:hypothetical protein DL96DRAFT_1575102 [Flagelloscypha sp. PMI_526]